MKVINADTLIEALALMTEAKAQGYQFGNAKPTWVGHKWFVASIPEAEQDHMQVKVMKIGMQIHITGSFQAVEAKYESLLAQGAIGITAPAPSSRPFMFMAIVDTVTQTDFIW